MNKGIGLLLVAFLPILDLVFGQGTLFPAIITFGDSAHDVGNNNNRRTSFKANFFPYGREFPNREATGRFSDGKIILDFTAESLGFNSTPPAYLSPEASGQNLRYGVSFATAGTGYFEETSVANAAIPLPQQLKNFQTYKEKLAKVVGMNQSLSIVSEALFLLTAGNADFFQNYYFSSSTGKEYNLDSFTSVLLESFSSFAKELYGLGARRLGVTNLPPMGCLPAARTLLKYRGVRSCNAKLNDDAEFFNGKLNATVNSLKRQLPGFKMVAFNIYEILLDIATSPSKFGIKDGRRPCCQIERNGRRASVLCARNFNKLCANSSAHVFFDAVHPSEAANKAISDAMLTQGFGLI